MSSTLTIESWMTLVPVTIMPNLDVRAAIGTMRSFGFRHLPVVEMGRLEGVVSDRDLTFAHTIQGFGAVRVEHVMERHPYAVSPDEPVSGVLKTMRERKIGSAVVTAPSGEVIGIFTSTDAIARLEDFVDGKAKRRVG